MIDKKHIRQNFGKLFIASNLKGAKESFYGNERTKKQSHLSPVSVKHGKN